MPAIGTGASREDMRRPKYADAMLSAGVRYSCMDYGLMPVFFVAAEVTPEQHTTLAAQADVIAIPADITQEIGAGVATVQARLEQLRIPADWVTASHTYRQVLRRVLAWFMFAQRHHGLHGERLFPDAADLETRVGQLDAGLRQRLIATAGSLALNTSAVTLNTSIRQLLGIITNQLSREIRISGEVI